MKKFIIFGLMTLSMLFGILTGMIICKTSSVVNATPKLNNIQNTSNIQGVSYDYVYVNGTRVGGSPGSDRKIKKNIKELKTDDLETLIEEVKELPIYKYDYKKEYSDFEDNLGIIIQDLKDNSMLKNALHIYECNDVLNYSREDLAQVDFVLIKHLLNKIDKLEEEIKQLKEDK